MNVKSMIATLLLMVAGLQTTGAQNFIKVWSGTRFELFRISEVDSVQFVCLATDIYLSQETLELKESETYQLTATVYPVDADDKTIAWSSSESNVASVDGNGLVTAIAAGEAVVTATATDGSGVKAECRVTVTKAGGETGFLTCPDDNHPHAINLGLPSGTMWCCCNVGASTPEGYGGYYAWGETSEKSVYNWDTYAYGSSWNNCVDIGSDIAGTSYDVAHVSMGAPWRMPSTAQQQELINKCSRQWTQQNGVNGILVTGPSGGQVFLPAAGSRWNGELNYAGGGGYYWSSSLYPYGSYGAYDLLLDSEGWGWDYYLHRYYGLSVRAVCR